MPFAIPKLPRRNYGIELETASGIHATINAHPGFGAKCDCSISGLEYVSPILRGRAGLRRIRDFMVASPGMRVDRACGFHAHFDMNEKMTSEQRFYVAAAYLAVEEQFFAKVSPSRRSNQYCYRWAPRYYSEFLDAAQYRDNFYDMARMQDRYNWLNIRAFVDHGTFENRLHQGTWSFPKVRNWLRLNLRFIKAASRLKMGRNVTAETFKDNAAACLLWAESDAVRLPRSLQLAKVSE